MREKEEGRRGMKEAFHNDFRDERAGLGGVR